MTRPINTIVIHCSASREGKKLSLADITAGHKARGFNAVGYHYVILLDGTVERGRPESVPGAHVQGHNAKSIGVCYVGGLAKDGTPKDTRTPAQLAAMRTLVDSLRRRYPNARVCGHRDLSPDLNGDGKIQPREWMKQCPCFDVQAWLAAA
jgi:N-acetylmuramoyl-L-alanine amidase